jgi:hypothetical protein
VDLTKLPLGIPSAILILLGAGLILDADAWGSGIPCVLAGIACLIVERRRRPTEGAA